jgi:hypothetical protein
MSGGVSLQQQKSRLVISSRKTHTQQLPKQQNVAVVPTHDIMKDFVVQQNSPFT